jgi:hypothetical protein
VAVAVEAVAEVAAVAVAAAAVEVEEAAVVVVVVAVVVVVVVVAAAEAVVVAAVAVVAEAVAESQKGEAPRAGRQRCSGPVHSSQPSYLRWGRRRTGRATRPRYREPTLDFATAHRRARSSRLAI